MAHILLCVTSNGNPKIYYRIPAPYLIHSSLEKVGMDWYSYEYQERRVPSYLLCYACAPADLHIRCSALFIRESCSARRTATRAKNSPQTRADVRTFARASLMAIVTENPRDEQT